MFVLLLLFLSVDKTPIITWYRKDVYAALMANNIIMLAMGEDNVCELSDTFFQ